MKKLFAIGALVLAGACTSDFMTDSEATGPEDLRTAYVAVPDTARCVTAATVESVARLFPLGEGATRSDDREIGEIRTVLSEEGTPLYYIVNYANDRGFVIVSATKDYMPVMAFSDEGRFDLEAAAETGASLWMAEQRAIVSEAASLPDSVKSRFRAMWTPYNAQREELTIPSQTRSYDDVVQLMSTSVAQWQAEGYTVYRLIDYKETDEFRSLPQDVQNQLLMLPYGYANGYYGNIETVSFVCTKTTSVGNYFQLLDTKWDQRNSYNMYVPNSLPLGCVTVAVGQIMRYYKYPATYNWDQMPGNYATTTSAQFLYDVGQTLGINYAGGSSSSNINSAAAALVAFGYKTARKYDHSASIVKAQLDMGRPVYMRGEDVNLDSGHAWVCDGYYNSNTILELSLWTLENCPSDYEPKCMLNPYNYSAIVGYVSTKYHMNWGWNGLNNGFFTGDSVAMSVDGVSYNFAHNRKDLIIYPY